MSDMRYAAKFAMHNKNELEKATLCGCFYCLALFNPQEIKEWTDNGDTAICPFCNVDAVLSETSEVHLDKETLNKLNTYWF